MYCPNGSWATIDAYGNNVCANGNQRRSYRQGGGTDRPDDNSRTCHCSGVGGYGPVLGYCTSGCNNAGGNCTNDSGCFTSGSQWNYYVFCACMGALVLAWLCTSGGWNCGLQGCFQEDTDIDTPDGKKPIQDIKVGDTVKSYDTKTKKINESKVIETFVHEDSSNLLLINGIIKTTTNHPFYINDDKWVEAFNLKPGDKILHVDGEYHEIETIEMLDYSTTVYNFEVENDHTYFAEGYLVHNKVVIDPDDDRVAPAGEDRSQLHRLGGAVRPWSRNGGYTGTAPVHHGNADSCWSPAFHEGGGPVFCDWTMPTESVCPPDMACMPDNEQCGIEHNCSSIQVQSATSSTDSIREDLIPRSCGCDYTNLNLITMQGGVCSSGCSNSGAACTSDGACSGGWDTWDYIWCGCIGALVAIAVCLAAGCLTCFQEDTDIETPDGKKPIQDIKIGDIVKSYNTKTKQISESKVIETFTHKDAPNLLTINGIIKTTTNHPFYTDKDEWIEAGNLKPGDKILHVDGEYHKVETLEQLNHSTTVYNFEVENDHTYFAEGYLVHNKGTGEEQKSPRVAPAGEDRMSPHRRGGRIRKQQSFRRGGRPGRWRR